MKKNLGQILKQAQKVQAQIAKTQKELEQKTVEASAGGGMVTAVANGSNQVVSIKIEPDVVDPNDIEMLQDLVIAAVNEALRRVQEMTQSEMAKITGGMGIPGLM